MGDVIYAVFPDNRKPAPIAEPPAQSAMPETIVFPEHMLKPTSVDAGMPSDSGYPA